MQVSAQNRPPRYESVLRFECKMAIQYEASVQRFVFDDAEKNIKYFTACTFEVRAEPSRRVGTANRSLLSASTRECNCPLPLAVITPAGGAQSGRVASASTFACPQATRSVPECQTRAVLPSSLISDNLLRSRSEHSSRAANASKLLCLYGQGSHPV